MLGVLPPFTVVQAGADPNNQSAGHRETGVHIAARCDYEVVDSTIGANLLAHHRH
jgi:hypothetical protein